MFPTGFTLARLRGGPGPSSRDAECKGARIVTLPRVEHKGIKSLTVIPVGSEESPLFRTHCAGSSPTCGRKQEHPYKTKGECGGEENSPRERSHSCLVLKVS